MTTNNFIRCLFEENEYTCYGFTPKDIDLYLAKHYNLGCTFVTINPMDSSKTRADSSVVKYRNILIEMDKVPLEEQDQYIEEIGMPYSTAVFSGKKSIHYIISLETPVADEQLYRALVKRVYKAVGEEKVDLSCKNPSRFSRLPGHIRSDTGKEQELLSVKGRVPNVTLELWLEQRGVPKEEIWENMTPEPRSTFKNPSRLYSSTKYFLMNGAPHGEWNPKIFKAAADLCRCGYTETEAYAELRKVTGKLDFSDMKTISSAFRNEMKKK